MRITIIGAGNVGFHLSQRLHEIGHTIIQVYSRQTTKAIRTARMVNAKPIAQFSHLEDTADLYIIAVKDDVIGEVAQKMRKRLLQSARVVHTSGSVPSTVLAPYFDNFGVLYPLQTFSLATIPDFSQLPILIHTSNDEMMREVEKLAKVISPKVYRINDEQRSTLHVTAVIVNNFTNHLFAIAENILQKEELPKEILLPLIQETVRKIKHIPAQEAQTGPAKRKDTATIQRHIAYLEQYDESYQEIYKVLTESIGKMYE